jgi:hypothetical protein
LLFEYLPIQIPAPFGRYCSNILNFNLYKLNSHYRQNIS